jgi:pyruvate carboxylase
MLVTFSVSSANVATEDISRPKADPNDPGQVGAPMSGVVIELRVHVGSVVKKGDPLAVLSAMYLNLIHLLIIGKWKWSSRHRMLERSIKSKSAKE